MNNQSIAPKGVETLKNFAHSTLNYWGHFQKTNIARQFIDGRVGTNSLLKQVGPKGDMKTPVSVPMRGAVLSMEIAFEKLRLSPSESNAWEVRRTILRVVCLQKAALREEFHFYSQVLPSLNENETPCAETLIQGVQKHLKGIIESGIVKDAA